MLTRISSIAGKKVVPGIKQDIILCRAVSISIKRFSTFNDKESWKKPITRPSAFPDFIHAWNRRKFKSLGWGLTGVTGLSWLLIGPIGATPYICTVMTTIYWALGLKDISQPHYAVKRNFPVLGNFRYIFEILRPEIRQYFIEGDYEAVPYHRQHRVMAYQRSKEQPDTQAFGTQRNVYATGYEWANHSLWPLHVSTDKARVTFGNEKNGCKQPYSGSILNISGMSYGALSSNAVLALNEGAKMGKFFHNTGEGGMSEFHLQPGGDIVWNIGTGYFGCGRGGKNRIFDADMFQRNANLPNCKMIEIKLSQGAKPAHGGLLPKEKITKEIAFARGLQFPAFEDCESPSRHSAFNSPKELCQFIKHLRDLSHGKPVGLKLCVGQPEEFSALCHAMIETNIRPDFITVDGGEGGTGAAPPEFSNSIGMPMQEGLTLVSNMLIGSGLKDDIKVIASGKILSGFSIVRTLALGADTCNAARAFMFALGCIQAVKCNTNRCPTGVATQDPDLMFGLDPANKAYRVAAYHKTTVRTALDIIGAIGVNSPNDLHGHHIMRRVSPNKVRTLDELYPRIAPGSLLRGEGPKRLQEAWDLDDGIVQRSFIY